VRLLAGLNAVHACATIGIDDGACDFNGLCHFFSREEILINIKLPAVSRDSGPRHQPRLAHTAVPAAVGFCAGGHAADRQLTIYCGVDEAWCRAMATTYQKETGVDVTMTRMSAGEIYARLRAEKANPQADIWWGGTGDPHLQAADEGLTDEYKSAELPQ